MIKKLFFTTLSLTALNIMSQGPGSTAIPNVAWKNFFSEKTQISNVPSAIDANNNVYQTGYTFPNNPSNKDATTIKYDAAGTFQFSISYDNGGADNAKAIVLDVAGNFYITGESDGTGTLRDIFTAKYSPTGVLIWVKRFNGASNGHDVGNAITLDGSGNVYVTGFTTNASGNKDYVTIKYDASGTQQFAVIFGGAGNQDDNAIAVVVNTSNNRLYITGSAINASGNSDIVTQRLNITNGNTIWTKSENGSANGNDYATALLAYNNDVVVVGKVTNTTTNDDYITSYYNGNNGNTTWSKLYDFVNTNGGATALTVDATGNFAVTGSVLNSTIYEYHTVLYNTAGTQQWVSKVSTNLTYATTSPQIAVDAIANHFYVCGQKLGVGSDIFVYQLTPSGNKSWEQLINGAQNGQDAGIDLVVNSTGDIYVAGAALNSNAKFDYATIKINQTPVYFPIDYNNVNEPKSKSHYFYPNVGEVRNLNNQPATEVLFSTKSVYPQQYILANNNLSFLIAKLDTTKNYPSNDSLHRVDLEFVKGNANTKPYPFEFNNDAVENYFLTYVSANPVTDNKGASRIMIPNIYPNIDLHYYSNSSGLKMYFVVKPTGNPNDILMNFNGASGSSLSGNNDLTINTLVGSFKFAKPQVYNVSLGLTTPTVTGAVSWSNVSGNTYKINTGTYNTALPLVIQINQGASQVPVTSIQNLNFSSYLGGAGGDVINAVQSSNSGHIFVTGSTTSLNFPPGIGLSPFQTNSVYSNKDGFIAQFNSGNVQLSQRTYFGGNNADQCIDVEVDFANQYVYVVGITTSSIFPIQSKTGAFNKSNFEGPLNFGNIMGNDKDDGFILQMDFNLQSNNWCTYYGGSDFDYISDCKLDGNKNLYITGSSTSTNIPVFASGSQYSQAYNVAQKAQDPTFGRVYDAVIAKFTATSLALNWATYYGSDINTGTTNISDDDFSDLAFDASNNIYFAGRCGGINLPAKLNNHFNNGNTFDGIVVKFLANGQLVSSKYSQGSDWNNSIKINNNKVYTCGYGANILTTLNSNLYYFNGVYNNGGPSNMGLYDGNFMVYDINFNLIHASYLGGDSDEKATDLQFDNNGAFYICGGTKSTNYPTITPPTTYSSTNNGQHDYFISALKENNTNLLWSTQFGSAGIESNFGSSASMTFDQFQGLLLGGISTSTVGFPVVNAGGYFQPNGAGGYNDATLTRFSTSAVNVIGIKEFDNKLSLFSVYPNPTQNLLNIKETDLKFKEVAYIVYNMLGQKVLQGNVNIELSQKIDVSSLYNGTYIINFVINQSSYNTKFIKVN